MIILNILFGGTAHFSLFITIIVGMMKINRFWKGRNIVKRNCIKYYILCVIYIFLEQNETMQ